MAAEVTRAEFGARSFAYIEANRLQGRCGISRTGCGFSHTRAGVFTT